LLGWIAYLPMSLSLERGINHEGHEEHEEKTGFHHNPLRELRALRG